VYYHGRERTKFNKGDRIAQGAKVYVSGSTGASTGPHLHFELRKSRKWGNTQDPMAFIGREVTLDIKPSVLKVDGKLGKLTWRRWQETLKRDWGYEGIIDGKPGPMTYRAIQRSCGAKVDGILGPETRKKVQKRLKDQDFYLGELDGIWGRGTITALQRALNQNHY
jgi:peptidoglycan hydrolase-like protein with peptidoglycan-binding domain